MIDLINHLSCTSKGCEEMNIIDCPRRVKKVRVQFEFPIYLARTVTLKKMTLKEHKAAWLTLQKV